MQSLEQKLFGSRSSNKYFFAKLFLPDELHQYYEEVRNPERLEDSSNVVRITNCKGF